MFIVQELTSSNTFNVGTLLIGLVSGLAGWVLRDLRNRISRIESKTEAVVVALFYLVANDPEIPPEAKEAVRKAMLPTR